MNALVAWLRPWAEALVLNAAPGTKITSVYRSWSYQASLYTRWLNLRRRGLSNEAIAERYGLFTPARPGFSMHQYRRAFDLSTDLESLQRLGAIWKGWGGTWSMKDPIHFQA